MKRQCFTFSLDPKVQSEYKRYCKMKGYEMSRQIELFMIREIKKS